MAREQRTTQPRGANTNVATRTPPMLPPTAIAARRSRPARGFFLAVCCDPPAGSSGGVAAPASVVATDVFAERPLDLQQLALFVLDQLFDLGDVLRSGFVQIFFRATDFVLAGLAVLAD